MDETRNEDTFGKLPTLGRPIPEEKEPGGPARTWTDEDAERETLKRPVSPEEMTLAGRYKVLRRLGEGGMGSVWLAEDLKLDGRKVAIKMLPAVLAGKKGAYRQVKQEALMAMKLSHPNIATVRAFEEEDGNPFLVMDYIEGQGLDDILAEKGKLSEEETLRLLPPVAAALDYAHAQGVVHRDVKPGNVIVRKDGTPFVLDFGIAREIQETMTRVTGKFVSGTLLYMSPEQLRGRAPKAAQDVYSFAAMAYECLTGHPPFYRGAVEDQIKNELPEELPEEIEKSLRCAVMTGLAKEPESRPSTCSEMLLKCSAASNQTPGPSNQPLVNHGGGTVHLGADSNGIPYGNHTSHAGVAFFFKTWGDQLLMFVTYCAWLSQYYHDYLKILIGTTIVASIWLVGRAIEYLWQRRNRWICCIIGLAEWSLWVVSVLYCKAPISVDRLWTLAKLCAQVLLISHILFHGVRWVRRRLTNVWLRLVFSVSIGVLSIILSVISVWILLESIGVQMFR